MDAVGLERRPSSAGPAQPLLPFLGGVLSSEVERRFPTPDAEASVTALFADTVNY